MPHHSFSPLALLQALCARSSAWLVTVSSVTASRNERGPSEHVGQPIAWAKCSGRRFPGFATRISPERWHCSQMLSRSVAASLCRIDHRFAGGNVDRFPDRGNARTTRRLRETEAKRTRFECPESAESRSRDSPGIPAKWGASDTGSRLPRSRATVSTKPSCHSRRRALRTRIRRSSTSNYARRLRFQQQYSSWRASYKPAVWRPAAENQKNNVQLSGQHDVPVKRRRANPETPHDQKAPAAHPFPRARFRWPSGFEGNFCRWQSGMARMPGCL